MSSPRRKTHKKIKQKTPPTTTTTTDLEYSLLHRPDQSTLVDRNILKDPQVAPTLIKASEKIKWEKKSNYLTHKIHDRPEVTSLIDRGIIKQQEKCDSQRQEVASHLEYLLNHRPHANDLKQKHIMPQVSTSPAIHAVQQKLEKNSHRIILSNLLQQRPSPEEVREKLLPRQASNSTVVLPETAASIIMTISTTTTTTAPTTMTTMTTIMTTVDDGHDYDGDDDDDNSESQHVVDDDDDEDGDHHDNS